LDHGEDIGDSTWDDTWVFMWTRHGVGLTRTGATIGKDGSIVSEEERGGGGREEGGGIVTQLSLTIPQPS